MALILESIGTFYLWVLSLRFYLFLLFLITTWQVVGVRPWGSESLISKCDNKLGQNVSVRIGKLAQKAIIYSDKEIEKEK